MNGFDADDWAHDLHTRLLDQTANDPVWNHRLQTAGRHLVILASQYLQAILAGTKTIESRFSRVRHPPFGKVHHGDILILKQSSGDVLGLCTAAQIWSLDLATHPIARVREQFGQCIGPVPESFWDRQSQANYVSLIQVENVRALFPIPCGKRDRRPWVIFKPIPAKPDRVA